MKIVNCQVNRVLKIKVIKKKHRQVACVSVFKIDFETSFLSGHVWRRVQGL